MPKSTKYSRASAHALIDFDGTIYTLVSDADRAWHAGESKWWVSKDRGMIAGLNNWSLGVELMGDGNKKPFTDEQYQSLIAYCKLKMQMLDLWYPFFLGHEHIAQKRKPDPGLYFNWKSLYKGVFHT